MENSEGYALLWVSHCMSVDIFRSLILTALSWNRSYSFSQRRIYFEVLNKLQLVVGWRLDGEESLEVVEWLELDFGLQVSLLSFSLELSFLIEVIR